MIAHKRPTAEQGTLLLHQRVSLLQMLVCMQNCYISLVGGLSCSALGLTVGLVCLALDVVPCTLDFTYSSSPRVLSQQQQTTLIQDATRAAAYPSRL